MIALLVTLAALSAYAYGGYRYAISWAVRETEKDIRRWQHIRNDPREIARSRRENLGLGWGPGLVWPFAIAFRVLGDDAFERMPLSSVERDAALKDRERRILELERQLGIKP